MSKVVNCPLCPVRVSADIFLLDHFCKRHTGCKEEPSKEVHVRSAQWREAFQRIRRLFNKYSHKRESHRDWLHFVRKMERVCINSSMNTCNNAQGNFTVSRVSSCNMLSLLVYFLLILLSILAVVCIVPLEKRTLQR